MISPPRFRRSGNEVQPEADTGNGRSRSIAGSTPQRSRKSRYSAAARSARERDGRPLGAEHHVLRGVLGGDEFDHVDAVAEHLERCGTQRVGDEVGLAAEQQPVPEQCILLARSRSARRARGGSTARRRSPPRRAARRRRSPRRVAVSQACNDTSRSTGSAVVVVDDRRRLEARLVVAEPLGDASNRLDHGCVAVEPDELDPRAQLSAVGDERETHVRLAAAGIDDANALAFPERQRRGGARRSAAPGAPCRASSSSRETADGRRAADAAACGRAARSRLPSRTASRTRRASAFLRPPRVHVAVRARAGARCARRRAAASSLAGQAASGTVSVRGPSTTLTAAPRRTSTGVAVTPSATSFRQPSPSARSSSWSMCRVCQRDHLQLRRRPAEERRHDPQLVRHLRRERRLGPSDGSEPCLPFEPVGADATGRAQTTWPLATKNPRRVTSRSPGTTMHTASCAQLLDAPELPRRPARAPRSGHAGARRPRSEVTREPLELRPQLRQRIVERVPFDTLQRTGGELRALAALQRAERVGLSRSRRRCLPGAADRGSGRDARSARSQAAAARGSGAAPRAQPRTRSRARAIRSVAARRAPLSTAGRWLSERK